MSNDFANNANRIENYTAALHADYDLGWANLVSITDFKQNDKQLLIDLDGTPYNIGSYTPYATTKSWSQEVRLSGRAASLNWVAGLYYLCRRPRGADRILPRVRLRGNRARGGSQCRCSP